MDGHLVQVEAGNGQNPIYRKGLPPAYYTAAGQPPDKTSPPQECCYSLQTCAMLNYQPLEPRYLEENVNCTLKNSYQVKEFFGKPNLDVASDGLPCIEEIDPPPSYENVISSPNCI